MTDAMTNDTRPPVAPVEGHYAMLRNGIVVGPLTSQFIIYDGESYKFTVDCDWEIAWSADGLENDYANKDVDIIATISPEAMAEAIALSSQPRRLG
jgi:hypothetical protein